MSKCKRCRNELKGIETTNWFDGFCEKCWLEKNYEKFPLKKGIYEQDKQIAELQKQLEEKEKEIKYYESELRDLQIDLDHYKGECFNLQDQLKSQPTEIIEKIRKQLGLKLKYKLNDEVSVLKICNQINEVLDTILKEYQK